MSMMRRRRQAKSQPDSKTWARVAFSWKERTPVPSERIGCDTPADLCRPAHNLSDPHAGPDLLSSAIVASNPAARASGFAYP